MNDLAYVLRITNMLLALGFLPLVYLRIKNTPSRDAAVMFVGIAFVCLAIITGSFQVRHQPFRISIPLNTFGLILCIVTAWRNQVYSQREARRTHRASDGEE